MATRIVEAEPSELALLAEGLLPGHASVEVWRGSQRLLRIARSEDRRRPDGASRTLLSRERA